jgi:uncharacterized membrane-anchored protein
MNSLLLRGDFMTWSYSVECIVSNHGNDIAAEKVYLQLLMQKNCESFKRDAQNLDRNESDA